MAETKTSEVLATETSQQKDLGLYSQGKLKLNFNDQSGQWEQNYEPVKPYKMFIPPTVKTSKATSTELTTPTVPTVTPTITQPAVPLVQPKDKGESFAERQQRENMEAYGPGQDPMTFAKTMSSIFTPETTQNRYYTSRGILKQDGDKLTVNFDMIDEKGGYGLPSFLGAAFRFAEKDIMESSLNKMRYVGIIEGEEIKDTKGSYSFTVNQDEMNKYNQNASVIASKLQGGYFDTSQGRYVQKNYYLNDELKKLGNEGATKFISDLAISSSNDNMKNIIDFTITSGSKGAAAALIAWQTKTDLDLDATALFGISKYNEGFKQSYTDTLNKLKAAEKETFSKQPSGVDTKEIVSAKKEEQRNQSESMKNTFNALIQEAKQARDPQVKTALLNRASAYSGASDIAEPKADGTQYPSSYGGVYQGDTKKTSTSSGNKSSASSGSSSNKPAPTQYQSAGKTVSSGIKKKRPTSKTTGVKVDQAGRIRGGI